MGGGRRDCIPGAEAPLILPLQLARRGWNRGREEPTSNQLIMRRKKELCGGVRPTTRNSSDGFGGKNILFLGEVVPLENIIVGIKMFFVCMKLSRISGNNWEKTDSQKTFRLSAKHKRGGEESKNLFFSSSSLVIRQLRSPNIKQQQLCFCIPKRPSSV